MMFFIEMRVECQESPDFDISFLFYSRFRFVAVESCNDSVMFSVC